MSKTTHELQEEINKLAAVLYRLDQREKMSERAIGELRWDFRLLQGEIRRILILIQRILNNEHHYTVKVTGAPMAITVGATGTFAAQLEDNGNPIPLPAGSTFAWTSDDSNAGITASSDTLTAVVSVPATDTATSITVTATTIDPDGKTVQGSVTVPIIPGVSHTFTVSVTQSA